MKEDYQKALKKSILSFLLNPVPFILQSYQKQKVFGTSDQSLFRLQAQKNSFISYILSDQVRWCNIKWFLSYSKNYVCKFKQAISWHRKLFHYHLSFWIWKICWGREKRENEKSFLDEIKNFFIVFEVLSFGEKIKIWQKITNTS